MKNCKYLSKLPNKPITNLGISFRKIAYKLEKFKKKILSYPLTKEFLKNPYYQSEEFINNIDRLWARVANETVNDYLDIPPGFGKRILFCSNDGNVFIDVSTYIKDSKKWLNFSILALNTLQNYKFINNPTVPQYNVNINSNSQTFNYEQTNYDNVINNSNDQSKIFTILKCGSKTPPSLDPNDLTPQKTTATTFQEVDLHTTRTEIIQSINTKYGYTSRYSGTTFTPNYYVATQLNGADEYTVFIRLSYFLL